MHGAATTLAKRPKTRDCVGPCSIFTAQLRLTVRDLGGTIHVHVPIDVQHMMICPFVTPYKGMFHRRWPIGTFSCLTGREWSWQYLAIGYIKAFVSSILGSIIILYVTHFSVCSTSFYNINNDNINNNNNNNNNNNILLNLRERGKI